jgi:hypothetical protein
MRVNGRKCAADLCFLVPVFFFTMLASAQLSSPVSGSLSEPLDTNIYGLDSGVAPTTSSTITPGANNLLTPDEHVLPYDAIGASVVASPLNPSLSQASVVGRLPFQVDNSLRDASIITGLHFVQPGIIVDFIARKSAKPGVPALPQSSWLNESTSTQSSLESLRGKSISGPVGSSMSEQSSWRAGGTSAALILNPPDRSLQTSQQSGKSPKGTKDISLQKQSAQSGHDSGPQPEKARDYSRSPLEKTATGQDSVDPSASPFDRLDTQNFFNPDIISTSSPHKASTKGMSTSFTSRAQPGSFTRRSSGLPERRMTPGTRDRGISNSMARLTKLSETGQVQKPKWHNPILQQMETEANSARQ